MGLQGGAVQLGAQKGMECSQLSLNLQQPAFCLLCSTEALFTPPATLKRHLFGKELRCFATHSSHPGVSGAFFSLPGFSNGTCEQKRPQ